MKAVLAGFAVAFLVAGTATAQEKKFDSAKLIGKWELTKSESGNAPKGAIVEFMKDNKLSISAEADGTKIEFSGTYKVDGDKLTVTIKPPAGKEETETDTIKSLTDDKLVLVDKDKKETEFVKKK